MKDGVLKKIDCACFVFGGKYNSCIVLEGYGNF